MTSLRHQLQILHHHETKRFIELGKHSVYILRSKKKKGDKRLLAIYLHEQQRLLQQTPSAIFAAVVVYSFFGY